MHIKESVPWKDIEFQDNQGCIAMLEKPPNGILRLLDSQCKAPNPTEQNFCKELNKTHAKADFIVPTRKQRMTDEEGYAADCQIWMFWLRTVPAACDARRCQFHCAPLCWRCDLPHGDDYWQVNGQHRGAMDGEEQ